MQARRQASEIQQQSATRVIYPDSDGKPMAETPEHIDELIHCLLVLRDFYAADPSVYVGADMFFYYEEGNPRAAVAPDLFVAKGVSKTRRRSSYRLWEEGAVPCFILELTSPSTAAEDRHKAEVYGRLGVQEYLLYDPRPEARTRRAAANLLQGFHLGANGYERIPAEPDGGIVSEELGLRVAVEGEQLQWYDLATGARLLDPRERAEAAQARAAAAEARVAELEALLHQQRPPGARE